MLKLLSPLFLLDFFTLKLSTDGGGGGSSQPTQQNVTQTNLPEYARPYFENLLERTQAQSYQGYTPYTGARLAGFTPEQSALQTEISNLNTPGQFGQATSALTAAGTAGMGAAGAGLGRALSYNPASAGMFGAREAAQYMSPYASAVTNQAVREATLKGAQDKNALMSGAIGRGTFGGARQALLQSEQQRNLNQNLADIRARGAQDAYTNAQAQFNADQARQQQAQQYAAGLGGQLFGTGLGAVQQAGAGLGALGSQQQAADLSRLQTQQSTAAQQQQMSQNQLDMAYQDFLRQRDYPQEQLGFYSNVLRGLPVQLASTQQTYQAAPSVASQIGGLGLAGLGLAKALG